MFESDVFLMVLESSFYHILQSLPDHNWQEHDAYDLEAHDAERDIFLDVFKSLFFNNARKTRGLTESKCNTCDEWSMH